jgi:hypothetical protein
VQHTQAKAGKLEKKGHPTTINSEYVAAIRQRRIKASIYGKKKKTRPACELSQSHQGAGAATGDMSDLKQKARSLRMQATRNVSLDNAATLEHEIMNEITEKSTDRMLKGQDAGDYDDDASDTSLQLEELFGDNFPYRPETVFQRRVSESISSMSSLIDSFRASGTTDDDFYSSLVDVHVHVPNRRTVNQSSCNNSDAQSRGARALHSRNSPSDSISLDITEDSKKKRSNRRRAKARTALSNETTERCLVEANTPKRKGGRTSQDQDADKLIAKARDLRKVTRDDGKDRSRDGSKTRIQKTQLELVEEAVKAKRQSSHQQHSSRKSLFVEDTKATVSMTSDMFDSERKAETSHEKAFDRLSESISSIASKYFKTPQRSDDTIEDHSVSSMQRSVESSIDSDKRHLLYLGQLPNEQARARMLVQDSVEWKKLQQKMKESGMVTNEGFRQILNPLLEKVENERKTRKPPPVIFVEESGVGHATKG